MLFWLFGAARCSFWLFCQNRSAQPAARLNGMQTATPAAGALIENEDAARFLIQTTEAARILGVSGESIRAMERRGALPAVKIARGVRLFDRRVVEQLARERADQH